MSEHGSTALKCAFSFFACVAGIFLLTTGCQRPAAPAAGRAQTEPPKPVTGESPKPPRPLLLL
jgi:hypothetical protein